MPCLFQGYSPIHSSSWMNDMSCIKMMEKAGADFNRITSAGFSVLTYSLRCGAGSSAGTCDLAHMEPVIEYLLERTDIGR